MTILFRLTLALLIAITATSSIPSGVSAQASPVPPLQPGTTQSVACLNFASAFYYGMDVPASQIGGKFSVANPAYAQYIRGINKIHEILRVEGYLLQSTDDSKNVFGKDTAVALVKYQIANKTAIGEDPSGIFSEKTRNVINQKYGCISKATINLTAPNTNTITAKGEVMTIKWTAAKIPNTTDLTIQYVRENNSATTTIATQSNVRNGSGQYVWTIPSTITPGNYKVLVSLTGTSKSDISARTFEIKEKALEIIKPDTAAQVTIGNKLPITWRTSTTIKPADKIKVSLVGTLVSDTSAPLNLEIARVANNGSYTWTVPDRINNKLVTAASSFKVVLQTENGTYISTSSASIEIVPVNTGSTGTIVVNQPVAGAQYLAAQTVPVKWTSTGFKATDDVQISLVSNTGTLTIGATIATVKNTGTYNWTVPTSISSTLLATTTLNQYKIVVSSLANTSVRATSSSFSITPTQIQVAPKITVVNMPSSVARGVPINVSWLTNGAFPKAAKVIAQVIRVNGFAETLVTSSPSVLGSSNITTVTIPANTTPSATATTNDFKVVLVVSGLTTATRLDTSSDLITDNFSVLNQNANATISALTNIPSANSNIAYKGSPLLINVSSTNIPNNTDITAQVLTTSGINTNVVVLTKGKINLNASTISIPIPTTLLDGTYKVSVRTTLDARPLEVSTASFEVKDRPVVLPKITIGTVPASIERGVPYTLTWTSNGAITATNKVHIELVNAATDARISYLATSVLANTNSKEVIIPAGTATNASYKIRIVPVTGLTNIDSSSILSSNAFNVTFKSGQISAKTNRETTAASKGSPVTVEFTGTAPSATRLAFNLIKADGSTVSNVPVVYASMSTGQVKFNIPSTLATGQYKIGVSGTVDTNLVSTTTPAFNVVDPYVTFINTAGSGGITQTKAQNGSTTEMAAVFEIETVANGGILTKPLPANLTVVFENTVTGATFSPSKVVVSGTNIAKDSAGRFTILATLNTNGLAPSTSGIYKAKISKITYVFNGVTTTKTDGLDAYVTPATTLVR